MAKEISTQIRINAPVSKVWSILIDFDKYPEWNPFIKSLTGKIEQGQTITARIEAPKTQGMTFKPRILAIKKDKEFRWLGHFMIKGLFDGEHIFELQENADSSTLFIHREKFSGILVAALLSMIGANTRAGFEAMNTSLKQRAEGLIA